MAVTHEPATQYADDANLRARQRLWHHQQPPFDLVGWVLDVARVTSGARVLDVGCGNGLYLRRMLDMGLEPIGCDLSLGMLRAAGPDPTLIQADATSLPFGDARFDVVLAPHMLYHVRDRSRAASELRRVLRPGGVCVAVTNGAGHLAALRVLVEAAVADDTPGWHMDDPATTSFSLENGVDQLADAFASVERVLPVAAPVRLTDADIAAGYVTSVGDWYGPQVDRPWTDVVDHVRQAVQAVIDREGAFEVSGAVGALVCR